MLSLSLLAMSVECFTSKYGGVIVYVGTSQSILGFQLVIVELVSFIGRQCDLAVILPMQNYVGVF